MFIASMVLIIDRWYISGYDRDSDNINVLVEIFID